MPIVRLTRLSSFIAVAGSLVVVALFVAAAAGVGMTSMHRIGRLRIAPSTVALVLLPIPATAWIVTLWSRPVNSGVLRVLRILITVLLLTIAVICAALTFFVLVVRPVSRAS